MLLIGYEEEVKEGQEFETEYLKDQCHQHRPEGDVSSGAVLSEK